MTVCCGGVQAATPMEISTTDAPHHPLFLLVLGSRVLFDIVTSLTAAIRW
jgi:hypothetical protein